MMMYIFLFIFLFNHLLFFTFNKIKQWFLAFQLFFILSKLLIYLYLSFDITFFQYIYFNNIINRDMPYTGGLNATIDGIKILVFGTVSGVITIFYGIQLLAAMVSKFTI